MRVARTIALILVMAPPVRLSAQAADTPPVDARPVTKPPADTGKYALITTNDLLFIGGFSLITLAVGQLDERVAIGLQDTSNLPSRFTMQTAHAFNLIGIPGAYVATGGMFLVGRATRKPGLADAGLHALEAVMITQGLTYMTKWAFGRQRPYYAGINDADDFSFGKGLQGEQFSSFPSGHASAAFAAASSLTAEISSRWPHATVYAAPPLFATATLVAWARLQSNKHWLSDVLMGAGLGTLIGIKTVRFNHKHPHNRLDRWLLAASPALVPDGRGHSAFALMWTVHPDFLVGR